MGAGAVGCLRNELYQALQGVRGAMEIFDDTLPVLSL